MHVLEAEHIGFGGSGRNVGLVNPAVWVPPKQVSDMLGPEYGPAFIKKFGNAVEDLHIVFLVLCFSFGI